MKAWVLENTTTYLIQNLEDSIIPFAEEIQWIMLGIWCFPIKISSSIVIALSDSSTDAALRFVWAGSTRDARTTTVTGADTRTPTAMDTTATVIEHLFCGMHNLEILCN